MKVFVDSINLRLEGPDQGYLNVYKVEGNGVLTYVTGKKAYPSPETAARSARPAPGWIRVGVIPVQHYRNHVNAHVADYTAALKQHVINDMNAFLARVLDTGRPTVVGGLNTIPRGDEAPITEPDPKPAKRVRKPTKAKKPAKATKVAKKPAKAKKATSKPKKA